LKRFIRTREVTQMMGVSRSTLWRMVQNGTFPAPAHITLRSRGYLLETVEEWMMLRVEGADDAQKPPNGDAGTRGSASMLRDRSVTDRS
jgi:prophage regulatory protein